MVQESKGVSNTTTTMPQGANSKPGDTQDKYKYEWKQSSLSQPYRDQRSSG